MRGLIRNSVVYRGGSQLRHVDGILLLKGMTREVLKGVAVHELGHAWLFLEGVDGLPCTTEEGFCNVLAYLYHRATNSEEAAVCMRIIERSPDPIYGDGFWQVWAVVQHKGLLATAHHLRRFRNLPL